MPALQDGHVDSDDDRSADGDGDGALDGDPVEDSKSAKFNAKSRRIAAQWWRGRPFHRLVLTRLVMEPLRELLSEKLTVAGDQWERHQVAQLIQSQREGQPGHRDYLVTLAAHNTIETKSLNKARLLMDDPVMWTEYPTDSMIESNNCLAFRMLSHVRCSIFQDLIVPHSRLDIQIFALLSDPDLIEPMKKVGIV